MELHRTDNQTEHVLPASGTIGVAELPELRTRLLEAIGHDGLDFDLLLDARQVSAFDDAALPALTAGQSRVSSPPPRRLGRRSRCRQCQPTPQRPALPVPGLP